MHSQREGLKSIRRHNTVVAKRPGGAGRCLEAASMGVTVAVENARSRGVMSTDDAKHLSRSDRRQYERLCAAEWGLTDWEEGKSPSDMRVRQSFDDMAQFDNVAQLFGEGAGQSDEGTRRASRPGTQSPRHMVA